MSKMCSLCKHWRGMTGTDPVGNCFCPIPPLPDSYIHASQSRLMPWDNGEGCPCWAERPKRKEEK